MATSFPVLYSFRRCPFAMRARLALAASGQTCELREITLSRKPVEMLAASPKGTVPVLVLPDGTVIEQSLDIMLWALHRHDPQAWLADDAATMTNILQLIAACDGPFKGHLDRYKYPNRHALDNGDEQRDQGATFLAQLESRLATQSCLAGPHFGIADAAIAPFVRQFAHTDAHWFSARPWPHLHRWLATFEASPGFAHTMGKWPEWAAGNPPSLFAMPHAGLGVQVCCNGAACYKLSP